MKTPFRIVVAVCFATLLLAAAPFAQAQGANAVGSVQFVSGAAEIVRGTQTIAVAKGMPLLAGDLVRTGAAASVQLGMIDGAFISVRPSTEMRVEKYEFNTAQPAAGDVMLELLRGTMRTFTGELVRFNRDRFKMRTRLAVLGVRGSGNVLSHTEEQGTYNHTLTGAHSVTSHDAAGIERTLVSLPGQTIQVLPGMAPRFVPTPAFILAAATPPTKQAATDSEKKSDGTQTAAVNEAPPSSTTAAATSTTTGAATSTAQAATNAIVAAITSVQLPAAQTFIFGARTELPLATGGFEGVFPQAQVGGGSVQLNAAGEVTQVSNSTFATFLTVPGIAYPANYSPVTVDSATVAFAGGTHSDGFRSSDGSVIIGRWTGGSINVTPAGQTTTTSYALGPRSVSYGLNSPTALGTVAAFTGSASYTLSAATAPTDAAGHVGQLTSASVSLNFSSLTAALSAALTINSQNFTLAGSSPFAPADGIASWARRGGTNNMTIACSGTNCSTQGYESVVNAQISGTTGEWLAFNYRLVPNRTAGSGYADVISGYAALHSAGVPTIGIVLPQTGTVNLGFANFQDTGSTFAGNAVISGSLQANFSTRVASFNATVAASGSPTFNATASNVPIVGVAVSASTSPAAGIGAMTVTCTAGCSTQSATSGRFDAFFTNSSGTAGLASLLVGNASGSYSGTATLANLGFAARATLDLRAPSAATLGIPTVSTPGGVSPVLRRLSMLGG